MAVNMVQRPSCLGWIWMVFVLSLSSEACATSVVGGSSSNGGESFQSKLFWRKPVTGCSGNVHVANDLCAVCDPVSTGDCSSKCAAGNGDACSLAAFKEFMASNHRAAADLYERGCSLGSGSACESFARSLLGGQGRAKDETRGLELMKEMCHAGRRHACTLLAESYLLGQGGTENRPLVRPLLDESCRAGDSESCQLLGDLRKLEDDPQQAIRDARERLAACSLGDMTACSVAVTPLPQQ